MNTTSLFLWDLEPYRSPTSIIIIKGNLVWIVYFYNPIDTKKVGRSINEFCVGFYSWHFIHSTNKTKQSLVSIGIFCKLFHHLHSYICFTCTLLKNIYISLQVFLMKILLCEEWSSRGDDNPWIYCLSPCGRDRSLHAIVDHLHCIYSCTGTYRRPRRSILYLPSHNKSLSWICHLVLVFLVFFDCTSNHVGASKRFL